ncbi:hypothetical protein RKD23_003340 [Streptomyces sp. SAI-170]|uniref:DUF4232 domain-containing protein n=1 Tax=Streptomyces sp. SAI-170 TaxID=3377729 RepID=UPI003C7D765C
MRTRLLATVGAALTVLALTACDNGEGTRDEGAAGSTATAPSTAPGTQQPATSPGTGGAGDGDGGGKGTGGEGADSPAPSGAGEAAGSADSGDSADASGEADTGLVPCNGATTKVTAQPVSRPLNHMLLTVENTGSRPCHLTYYPVLRFDEMQWVLRAAEETKPQAVPTLAPGESGYAGVLLSAADGSGQGGSTGHRLTVAFQGATPNSSGGASATPPLPARGVYYDSALTVTYWQSDQDTALAY